MNQDILICGVGGQGTVLASKIIAASAMSQNLPVRSAETIGMAQRGGSVTSHVRIGSDVYSPLIRKGHADILLGFEPAEVVRNISYLKEGGIAIVNTAATIPAGEALSPSGYKADDMIDYLGKNHSCIFVDGPAECSRLGSIKFLNILLLGAASGSGRLMIEKETITEEIKKTVPAKFTDINLKAFETGYNLGK